jgi:hypothetical protein
MSEDHDESGVFTAIDKTPPQSAAAAGPSETTKNKPLPPITYPTPIAISLSGCGFLSSYHIGAMTCFQQHAKVSSGIYNIVQNEMEKAFLDSAFQCAYVLRCFSRSLNRCAYGFVPGFIGGLCFWLFI